MATQNLSKVTNHLNQALDPRGESSHRKIVSRTVSLIPLRIFIGRAAGILERELSQLSEYVNLHTYIYNIVVNYLVPVVISSTLISCAGFVSANNS